MRFIQLQIARCDDVIHTTILYAKTNSLTAILATNHCILPNQLINLQPGE